MCEKYQVFPFCITHIHTYIYTFVYFSDRCSYNFLCIFSLSWQVICVTTQHHLYARILPANIESIRKRVIIYFWVRNGVEFHQKNKMPVNWILSCMIPQLYVCMCVGSERILVLCGDCVCVCIYHTRTHVIHSGARYQRCCCCRHVVLNDDSVVVVLSIFLANHESFLLSAKVNWSRGFPSMWVITCMKKNLNTQNWWHRRVSVKF